MAVAPIVVEEEEQQHDNDIDEDEAEAEAEAEAPSHHPSAPPHEVPNQNQSMSNFSLLNRLILVL